MKIHELQLTPAKPKKRIGRGIGSGKGKTAGRGTKGQNSRPGFEGGQNPLAKRLPKKRGFAAVARTEYATVGLSQLGELKATTITNAVLVERGLVKNDRLPVKVLANGSLDKKLSVELQAATQTARAAITKAGGNFTAIAIAKSPKKPSPRNRAK